MPKTTTDSVRKYWRQIYPTCVICDQGPVDGAHIYGAGAYPHFKNVHQNGVGMCRKHHRKFDGFHRIDEKINWLHAFTCRTNRDRVEIQLDALREVVQEYRDANSGAIR